jgi:alpha-glucosidase (family GH31 glycosyl hydrolase)
VHAFTGFLETFTTYLILKSKNNRPFVLSRSSTLGTNKFGFHWTGDNYANFDFLKSSITDNFINNMWGVTMVGADICGFGGNTTE